MAKHVGVKLPQDLLDMLKKENVVATLATFSERGLPHTTPIQCIAAKGDESLILSIHKEHQGYHNLVWQKKVMISFMAENNLAYSILGRAGVVRAPSSVHPLMNIVRVDIIDIKSDRSILTRVESGVTWSYTSPEAQELLGALFGELRELSTSL